MEPMLAVQMSRVEWENVIDAIEYAIADRYYQAACTEDAEDKQCIEECAEGWTLLNEIIRRSIQ